MKAIKLPRKLKKQAKKALLSFYPLCDRKAKDCRICGISTNERFTKRKTIPVFSGKAITAHAML